MQVLLTGATGLIGSSVLDCLVARGDTVRALVQPEAGRPGTLSRPSGGDRGEPGRQ